MPSKQLLRVGLEVCAWLSASLLAGACGDASPGAAGARRASASDPEVRVVRRTYVRIGERDIELDLYLPRARPQSIPVVLMFHGGGWIGGSPRQARGDLQPFLAAGWAGVTPAYRLAPRDRAPAALEDAECALRWVGLHAAEYGLDPERIVVAGYSAGGYLALMLGAVPESSAFDRHCSGSARPRPAIVLNLAGITDLDELLADGARRDWAVEWVGPAGTVPAPAAWSPLRSLHPGGVPVVTLHGDRDDVVPYSQSVRLHRALDRLGIANRLVTLRGVGHFLPPSTSELAFHEATRLLEGHRVTPTPAGGRPSSR